MEKLRKDATEMVKHDFTEPERLEIGEELARQSQELSQMEEDKKAMASQLKAGIDAKRAEVKSTYSKLVAGHEYRKTLCEITYNDPTPGIKTIRRKDTMAIVQTTMMTPSEHQLEIDMETAEKKRIEEENKKMATELPFGTTVADSSTEASEEETEDEENATGLEENEDEAEKIIPAPRPLTYLETKQLDRLSRKRDGGKSMTAQEETRLSELEDAKAAHEVYVAGMPEAPVE